VSGTGRVAERADIPESRLGESMQYVRSPGDRLYRIPGKPETGYTGYLASQKPVIPDPGTLRPVRDEERRLRLPFNIQKEEKQI